MTKELCECGKPVIAKGLCRLCYDNARKIPRIAISEEIKKDVMRIANKTGWSLSGVCNYLMKYGLKFIEKREKIKKEWEID